MIGNKKIVGVCLTKIHDATRSDYVNRLHHLAQKADIKLIFFNSFVDFYNNDAFDEGARSVYSLINYELLDALVVVYDSFYNRNVASGIVRNARMNDIPVILVNGEEDGCWSILADYETAFKNVMRHVIAEHNVTDTVFIAGNRDNDPDSVIRISCYREVLEESGIPYDEERVFYGGYWDDPARLIAYDLVSNGKKPPQAIFCANDYMALAVCKELALHGYSVPEDVIVTGFDGVPEAEHFAPTLTTCCMDMEALAELTVQAVAAACGGEQPCGLQYSYAANISESCGCRKYTQDDFRDIASDLFHTIHEMEEHEDFEYNWIDRMLEISDMNELSATLSGCMLENSYVCLNSDFVSSAMELSREKENTQLFSDEMMLISSVYSGVETRREAKIARTSMVPDLEGWLKDDSSYILSSIYVGGKVCGYYAVRTNNIPYCKHKIKRVLKTINIAFNVAINHFSQMKLRQSMERAAFTNVVTGMPNLKGAVKWFEEFTAQPESHSKTISVSVYGLPKYNYLLENYGVDIAEDAMRFVSEALKLANQTDCYIAQCADDEFVVVNYYEDPTTISDVIYKATTTFFGIIEGYNSTSGKEYFVEVNCGCTVVNSGWEGSLEGFIKFANSEMYMNRLKQGSGEVIKENIASKEHYQLFEVLIAKNMFSYHFQPIVSAKTGEIYAYEALMRTDPSIGMNPLQVLSTAKEYHRLYDIEKATLFNIMARYAEDRDSFGGHMVFINTIPGHFLNDDDINVLTERYGEYLDSFVYELTEQDTVSDDELNAMRRLGGNSGASQIAIDDYGTGHSNIVNLMRYAPQIIKIDRFLITDIHKDQNKQMFVRSTIEFARLNGIKVLAEGVETSNELRMVIDLGVDLVQGYYTARPAPQPIPAISDDIRKEIQEANPLY